MQSILLKQPFSKVVETEKESSADTTIPAISDLEKRKQRFFTFIYEHIKPINRSILNNRKKLISLEKAKNLSQAEEDFIKQLAYSYRVISKQESTKSLAQIISELLIKVDVIPPALVLAQAANESAWGTSRFATEANNYFGIWCYKKGCGLAPLQRESNQSHQVRLFAEAKDSILYYTKLLNNSRSYKKLREIRTKLRQYGEPLSAKALLPGLQRYSERGAEYTEDILSLIRQNQLEEKYPLVSQ